jgi:hypothetical protein
MLRDMAATAQQQLNAANDSLLRILETDTSQWSESGRAQQQLQIRDLNALIERLESKIASQSGRRIFGPVRRVDY